MSKYYLFTDGACNNKKIGGIGVCIVKDNEVLRSFSKTYTNTTNNQMELLAIIHGLNMLHFDINDLEIVTDSMYCIGCITLNWQRNKNKLLWNKFDFYYQKALQRCKQITFKHTKGHQHTETFYSKYNNFVDVLARNASNVIKYEKTTSE